VLPQAPQLNFRGPTSKGKRREEGKKKEKGVKREEKREEGGEGDKKGNKGEKRETSPPPPNPHFFGYATATQRRLRQPLAYVLSAADLSP